MVANALWGWLNRWKKANWQHRGKPIWAAEIWQDIPARVEKLTVKVQHMDAHVSKSRANEEHHNNEQVDKAAKVKVSQGRDATYRWTCDRGVDLTMDNISQVIHNCETCTAIKLAKRVKPLWYGGRWLKYRVCVPSPSVASLPPLDTLKHLNVLPELRGPELDTALKAWPHQCRVQGKNDLPAAAGHTIPDTGQVAFSATWAHCWLMFSCCHQCPQVPFCLGTVQPHRPQLIALWGVIVAKVQDLALGLIKLHLIGLCPPIQPFQVSLQSHPTFQQIDTRSQPTGIHKFTTQRFNTHIYIINKNIEQNWPQQRPLRDTTGDWPPTGCSTIHHHSLGLATQPVLISANSAPVQAMGCQLFQECAVSKTLLKSN
ncbi:hypothetical protein DUI87_03662 [Hirundo rustica rustica]|uniref:RNase H type-1 domain-containing protein n=1 Tax=Hirundo rustica rustica TaxID=333673 RepID=A0A3M0L0T5_HIRRU|nr:hypothetical protein DUI87_03662 [Hirundo rustica rustica]